MGHCHLYPLHSWQDILLAFAEGTFPKGNGFPKICLRLPSLLPRRRWWTPVRFGKPPLWPTKKAKPPPKSTAQSIPVESGEHVQEFQVKWSRTKKFYTEPVKE